ncbi:hypothetical protein DESA109040_10595 [Deinococcus saxicola]
MQDALSEGLNSVWMGVFQGTRFQAETAGLGGQTDGKIIHPHSISMRHRRNRPGTGPGRWERKRNSVVSGGGVGHRLTLVGFTQRADAAHDTDGGEVGGDGNREDQNP